MTMGVDMTETSSKMNEIKSSTARGVAGLNIAGFVQRNM